MRSGISPGLPQIMRSGNNTSFPNYHGSYRNFSLPRRSLGLA